jgi:hypothetical protein
MAQVLVETHPVNTLISRCSASAVYTALAPNRFKDFWPDRSRDLEGVTAIPIFGNAVEA